MPIFEYRCDECGTTFEKLIRNTGMQGGQTCPSCGTAKLKTMFSPFAAHSTSRASVLNGGCPAGLCRTPELCGRT